MAPAGRRGDVRLPVAVGAATLAGVLYLAVTDPYGQASSGSGHVVCPLLLLTGLACPACGGQRAVHSLAHGDLAAAWAMNPLLVALAPVAVLAWARWLGRSAGTRPARAAHGRLSDRARVRLSSASAWVLLVVVVAFGVLRNVPALRPALGP